MKSNASQSSESVFSVGKMRAKLVITGVCLMCLAVWWILTHVYNAASKAYESSQNLTAHEYSWVLQLLLNLMGYSTVLLPLFALYKYLERTKYFEKTTSTGPVYRVLFTCFGEHERLPEAIKNDAPRYRLSEAAEFTLCFTGLMGAYLVWGLLQEKIMTQNYILADGTSLRFTDSQYLVFMNRVAALLIGSLCLLVSGSRPAGVPLYKFSYCSLTNVISAWSQYEVLKFVSFPTQVLSKSCKVLPVMAMGRLVSRTQYATHEYLTCGLLSVGMLLFLLGTHQHADGPVSTPVSGCVLLALYMCCDSFTSSWQGALLRGGAGGGGCPALVALVAVNMFSSLLTAAALMQRPPIDARLLQHGVFASDCALLSLSSTLGQLLIYRTIARFGAVVFTIIMTLRQAASILISCIVFGHHISIVGVLGVIVVLVAIFLRIYCGQRTKRAKKRTLT